MAYSVFAQYYDALTENVEYSKRADYLLTLLERLGHRPALALDLACGTGSLTLELFRRGLDIYGIDASVEMLSAARQKCTDAGADILFLCQKMQSLDLYGTVDTVFCTLDSLNHLQNREEVQKAFSRVSFFMDPGGWFLFDMNTPYKHEKILGGNTFVYDTEEVYCVWQNRFTPQNCKVDIDLDFFEKKTAFTTAVPNTLRNAPILRKKSPGCCLPPALTRSMSIMSCRSILRDRTVSGSSTVPAKNFDRIG